MAFSDKDIRDVFLDETYGTGTGERTPDERLTSWLINCPQLFEDDGEDS